MSIIFNCFEYEVTFYSCFRNALRMRFDCVLLLCVYSDNSSVYDLLFMRLKLDILRLLNYAPLFVN